MKTFYGAAVVAVALLAGMPGTAQEQPRRGGTLVYSIEVEPPTYDCQGTTTFGVMQTVGTHYSRLLNYDQDNYPKFKGDLAQRWEVSPDRLTYTFKLKPNVRFHDGSAFSSEDVKATYDRTRKPQEGVVSVRKARYEDIETIETPDKDTVVFRLSQPNSSMLTTLGSPWNCILSAAKIKEDPKWPVRNIMGTGAYRFVEHVAGSEWRGERFDRYFEPGKPYLDGFRGVFIKGAPMVNAIQGGQVHVDFRGLSPADAQKLKNALGDRIVVTDSPWVSKLDIYYNHKKKPFDDVRVRKALTLAVDRWKGAESISRIAFVKSVGGTLLPGSQFAMPAEELKKFPGYGTDIKAAREEARKLLKEAGAENLKFKLTTRNVEQPFQPVAIYLIDQWRQIGVTVEQEALPVGQQKERYLAANYEVGLDANTYDADEPNDQLALYLSEDRSPVNSSRYIDRTLDELYDRQKRATNDDERARYIREFETRLLQNVHSSPIVWWHRIVAHSPALKGWKILPSHYINQDLASVWLDPDAGRR